MNRFGVESFVQQVAWLLFDATLRLDAREWRLDARPVPGWVVPGVAVTAAVVEGAPALALAPGVAPEIPWRDVLVSMAVGVHFTPVGQGLTLSVLFGRLGLCLAQEGPSSKHPAIVGVRGCHA